MVSCPRPITQIPRQRRGTHELRTRRDSPARCAHLPDRPADLGRVGHDYSVAYPRGESLVGAHPYLAAVFTGYDFHPRSPPRRTFGRPASRSQWMVARRGLRARISEHSAGNLVAGNGIWSNPRALRAAYLDAAASERASAHGLRAQRADQPAPT